MIYQLAATLLLIGAAAPATDLVSVRKADFFYDRPTMGGFIESVATTHIPYEPIMSCYRWVLRVEPQHRLVPLREVFQLPAPAKQWGGVDGDPESPTSVAGDRSGATTQLLDSIEDGELSNSWCVADGDPQGAYTISVFAGEQLLHRFDFTVGSESD